MCRVMRCNPWSKGGWDPVIKGKSKNEKGKTVESLRDESIDNKGR